MHAAWKVWQVRGGASRVSLTCSVMSFFWLFMLFMGSKQIEQSVATGSAAKLSVGERAHERASNINLASFFMCIHPCAKNV